MRELTLFYFPECPHCANALHWQEELFEKHPEYREIPLHLVNENEERAYADAFDYWYVPTYYLGDEKLYEGITEKSLIEAVFRRAYEEAVL